MKNLSEEITVQCDQPIEFEVVREDPSKLLRLLEHCKYVYEEEKERRDLLNNTTRIYLTAFGFSIGVTVIKIGSIEKIPGLIRSISETSPLVGNVIGDVATVILYGTVFLFFTAFICTILAVRMWKRERLCDPEKLLPFSLSMEKETELLSTIIADYVVATQRNYCINEKKARLLSKALLFFISAITLFWSTVIFLYTIT